jgi:hypothetical protein
VSPVARLLYPLKQPLAINEKICSLVASGCFVWPSVKMNIYALYPSRKFTNAKNRMWVDFLRGYLPDVIARDNAMLAG